MLSRIFILLLFIQFGAAGVQAQRLSDVNAIGWFGSFNTIHLSKHYSLWLEGHWRRDNVITDWQQLMIRTGIQRHFKNGLSTMAGYAYARTYPYGDYPAGPHPIPEHRIFEQFMWNDAIERVGLNHRVRLEQRFLGKINQTAPEYEVLDWTYANRVRYQLRATVPLNNKNLIDDTWYIAGFDEIFIGFGKNVNQNVFDQNRVGLVAGYQLTKKLRAEGGYFNQTVQQGGLVSGREVFQYNHGLLLSLYLGFFPFEG
ncbi:DUF2490 domain-containing protein [Polluticoccus soli]|uniref:DUF2490 domain-containing protein n=1 Tax=Polluticoccus soli TaxID=3034150 RepID=UPI0023E301C5|nr:DUF2490 domain-containing protein [Flavipsychrobacter sp. JY13-12]